MRDIRAAFRGLPEQFTQLDPGDGLNLSDFGLSGSFDDVAVFASTLPFEFIYGMTSKVTGTERADIDSRLSSAPAYVAEYTQGIVGLMQSGGDLVDNGVIDLPRIGEASVGVFVVIDAGGLRLRQDLVHFRRANVVALVLNMHVAGTEAIVPVQDAARMLDEEILRVIAASG